MRKFGLGTLLLLLLVVAHAQTKDRTVLLAAHRAGSVEALDTNTLELLGSVKVLPLVDRVASGSDRMLFLREGLAPDFRGCCALYALDLKTREMTRLLEPTSSVIVSPDGKHVLTQRGNVGIEIFNVRTLQREPGIPRTVAPGVYGLSFSPDGRLLYGVSNFPAPTLDVLDFSERKLVRRFSLPPGLSTLGAWAGNDYYLYGYRKASGQLWRVKADGSAMETPAKINFPDAAPKCALYDQAVIGAGGRLFLFERFGTKGDRRVGCAKAIPGGLFSVDAPTGRLTAHLASEVHFAQVIPSADGTELYAVDVRDPGWSSVALVRLDAATGQILAQRDLLPDVWSIALATIPEELVPRGQVQAITK
jgi:hypothetical protein